MVAKSRTTVVVAVLAVASLSLGAGPVPPTATAASYDDLLAIFQEFRDFAHSEDPTDPRDYPRAMRARMDALRVFQGRLADLDLSGWSIAEQVDYHLVRGEMNGLEFMLRVMRLWERDPGFYSLGRAGLGDRPEWPLTSESQTQLAQRLTALPEFFDAARANLGNGEVARIPGDLTTLALRQMVPEALDFAAYTEDLETEIPELAEAARSARGALEAYLAWLETNHRAMVASAGVGRDNYNWLLKNVYLFPYTWEECRTIVHLEDNRVIAFRRLEEVRNRDVPRLEPVDSQEEYRASVLEALDAVDAFIRDRQIYTVPDYLVDSAYRDERLEATSGPWPERHDYFFTFSHREPLMEETHELVGHHYDLLRQQNGTHPIRNNREHEGPYNQSVARWEGLAFAWEEVLMHAGYLDGRSPRGREIVYEQAAFRTVRALSDLYMHAQEWSLGEAMEYSIANAPYGERLEGTNHLWNELGYTTLGMVGWHAQMVTGKVQFLKLLRDRSQQLGDDFVLGEFMDEFYALGALPMSLIRWEMTGYDDEIQRLLE